MDHPHYEWSPIVSRPPLRWPDDERVALCVRMSLEFFEVDPEPGTYQAGDMAGGLGNRPFPDYARLSHREYGHRVGVFRLLDIFERHAIVPMVAVDAMTAEHYPTLVSGIIERGAEIVAHGISVSRVITNAMTEHEERSYIDEALTRLDRATGVQPRGWFGPEYGESVRTPQLLASAGLEYVCDWANDDQPYRMTTEVGELYSLPTLLEAEDAYALAKRGLNLRQYEDIAKSAFDELYREGVDQARLLVLGINPWLIGQPFRVSTFESVLSHILSHEAVWLATGAQVIDAYRAQRSTQARDVGPTG